jgi:hypothetical protein
VATALVLDPEADRAIAANDDLVVPLARTIATRRLFTKTGEELHLFCGDKELSFDTPDLIAFGLGLAGAGRFRAVEATAWSNLAWEQVQDLLAALLDSGIVHRASNMLCEPLRIAREDRPSPLPPAPATTPDQWNDAASITAAIADHAIDPAHLEAVVPVFRVAHIFLDADGRQVGEANVFPKALRLEVPTQWRTCTYTGDRYQADRPMNVSALRAMSAHWPAMMLVADRVRSAYLQRFPDAANAWTVGHVERLAVAVLALPSYQLLRADGSTPNGALHPVLSNLFRVADGVRMVMHQMLFVPVAEPLQMPDAPVDAAEIHSYAERNHSFHSGHGVCAGPSAMIEEFLAVLLDGKAPRCGWPALIDPAVGEAIEAIEPALDYALLGLRSHGAVFCLWPRMVQAYADLGQALAVGEHDALRQRFQGHVERMRSSFLAEPEWREHRATVYDDMVSRCGEGLGRSNDSGRLSIRLANAERAFNDGGVLQQAVSSVVKGPEARSVFDAISSFLVRAQAIVAIAEEEQRRVAAHLGRAPAGRSLSLADLNVYNRLMQDETRTLPFLVEEIEQVFGIAIQVEARAISVTHSPAICHSAPSFGPENPARVEACTSQDA